MKEIDWPGTWFPIMERLGESTDMILAKIDRSGAPQFHVIPHTQNDGLGAMTLLLHGPDADTKALRKIKDPVVPHPLKTLWAILRYTLQVYTQKTLWRDYDPTKVGCSPAVAWTVFDVDTTDRINAYARARKVSLNTLLLLALDDAVRAGLVTGGKTRWAIPVNMRGAPGLSDESLNQFSAIHVVCPPDLGLAGLHARIRAKFKEGNHWANWALMHAGKLIGLERSEKFFIDGYKKPRPGTGGISSVGEWTSDVVGPDEGWAAFAMVSKISPISAVTLTVNGKLSLSLQLHPSLNPTPELIRDTVAHWIRKIGEISEISSLPQVVRTAPASAWQSVRVRNAAKHA